MHQLLHVPLQKDFSRYSRKQAQGAPRGVVGDSSKQTAPGQCLDERMVGLSIEHSFPSSQNECGGLSVIGQGQPQRLLFQSSGEVFRLAGDQAFADGLMRITPFFHGKGDIFVLQQML